MFTVCLCLYFTGCLQFIFTFKVYVFVSYLFIYLFILELSVFSVMEESNPEFDMYGAMEWNDGVGTLPGSQLKVCAQDP